MIFNIMMFMGYVTFSLIVFIVYVVYLQEENIWLVSVVITVYFIMVAKFGADIHFKHISKKRRGSNEKN